MERYDKNKNETYVQYIKRVTTDCENKKITYSEWGDYVLGAENVYSSENLRKSFYVVSKMLKNIENDFCMSEDEVVDKLVEIRDEIYKEKCKLQDANREKRNNLRIEARYENLVEVFKDSLYCNDIEIADYKKRIKNDKIKYAVLCLSDWHCGSKVDNQFNYYDIDTMVDRAMVIRDKAIDYCNLHSVTDLIIEINGDMVDGLIHISSRVEQEEGVLNQIVTVTNLLSKMINSMKPYFNSIKVVTTLGNHGRMTPNKTDSSTKENFEMLIPIMLRDKLKDVKVLDSKGLDFIKYEINDKIICVAHGHNDKLSSVVNDFSKIFKIVPNEVHLGHSHGYQDINDCDIITNVNGSLIGSDEYSLTIRKITKPSQNLIIYDNDRCVYELKAE